MVGQRIGTVERGSGDVSAHDGEGACEHSLRNEFRVRRTDAAGPGRGGSGKMQHWVCTDVGRESRGHSALMNERRTAHT